ncbi:DUF7547 family protein [Halopiger aswanensis]|uniref:Uncharacterized protein n=1 Tax=Halopiger aswanensis TaxID=148449 RepID=A0A419WP52_9EURY|nr:hypothetical protein [Halopiger aswanensis]RKD97270.1 hypothetical protein ATJ93_0255 [Halopiger aswanensis]
MADQDDDLADAIRELTRTLEDLRQALDQSDRGTGGRERRGWRPPLRPPTPRELLAFADEVAVPAALTALESSVRALEAFQRGLKLVRTERDVRDRTADAATASGDRADRLRETTLERLDTALAELQRAASEGTLPADDEARSLLTDARELRDEVDARLREATSDGTSTEPESDSSAVEIDIEEGTPDGAEADRDESESESAATDAESENSNVDVDAELETLKDQYAADDEGDPAADGENGTANERGPDSTPDEGNEDEDDADDAT